MRILTVISGEMTVASGARAQKQLRVKSVEKKLSERHACPCLVSLCRQEDRMRRAKFPPIGHAALNLGRVRRSVSTFLW